MYNICEIYHRSYPKPCWVSKTTFTINKVLQKMYRHVRDVP